MTLSNEAREDILPSEISDALAAAGYVVVKATDVVSHEACREDRDLLIEEMKRIARRETALRKALLNLAQKWDTATAGGADHTARAISVLHATALRALANQEQK